jgi:uncharacterized membrane protein (UPF0127 family)
VRYRLIRIVSGTNGNTLAARCRVARGLIQSVLGLHLLPPLGDAEGLLLPGATTIDTTFMRYPIDLVFLNRERRVTRVVPDMKPWRMVLSGHGGRDCLELPAGAAAASQTQVGDQLVFHDTAEELPPAELRDGI